MRAYKHSEHKRKIYSRKDEMPQAKKTTRECEMDVNLFLSLLPSSTFKDMHVSPNSFTRDRGPGQDLQNCYHSIPGEVYLFPWRHTSIYFRRYAVVVFKVVFRPKFSSFPLACDRTLLQASQQGGWLQDFVRVCIYETISLVRVACSLASLVFGLK